MGSLSNTQEIIISVSSAIAGTLSCTASITIIVMIFRSPTKLNNPFRRIIFGMSAYDIFQSISAVLSLFLSPSGERWGAIGNQGTCVLSGFIFQVGILGSPLYSLFLAFFYLCAIKFNMTNDTFKRKYEIFFHILINFSVWSSSIYLASDGYINFADTNCWIAPYPQDCVLSDDVECIRGEKAFQFQWIFAGYPLVFSFLSNLIVLFVLIWSMVQLERKLQSLNNSWRQAPDGEDANIMGRFSRRVSSLASSISSITPRRSSNTYEVVNITNSSSTYVLPNRSRRSILNQNNYQRGLINQAISYTTAFLAVYSFSFIYRILSQTNSNGAPFFIIFLARTTNPLQGIFNIIIYTRTRVASLRANSEHSWIKAFWIVIISGADHDVINSRNQRNRSRNRMSESGPSHTNTPISNSQRIRGVRFDEQSFPIPIQDQGSVVEKEPKSSQDQGSVVEKESKSSQDESGGLRESEIEMILRACGQATTAQTQEGKSGIRLNESDEVDEFIPPQDNRIIKS